MTAKEKSIRQFAKAMRTAHSPYIAGCGKMTPGMQAAWNLYVVECMKEVQDGRFKERHNN